MYIQLCHKFVSKRSPPHSQKSTTRSHHPTQKRDHPLSHLKNTITQLLPLENAIAQPFNKKTRSPRVV
ncbi:hypothetical protein H6F42_16785 [Pseudanabaena sp. FACHB-1998]|uniref:hypothetical protein n=1 Tax=Pseudanabaena sp. FACHB-1998 TaxID=2692858 RepID=UPI001680517C|nr:hypothetical protein [Pseudanabaena sp. FACHB-1998]MBD2178575.1 hypothetical protein [Pseudanabaena sp. FACHB-1998]